MEQVDLADALSRLKPGMRVLVPPGCGLPVSLVEELGRQADHLAPLTVIGGIALSEAPYLREEFADKLHFVSYHAGGPTRAAIARGQGRYVPLRYRETLEAFSPGGSLAADAVIVHCAPPDRKGRYSLGVSVSYPLPVARLAPLVIAQINPKMPRTLGDAFLEEDEIDVAVEVDEPLLTYRASVPDEVAAGIAGKIADLVEDGSTVQVGIGAVPEALLGFLKNKRDLQLYSLLVDSALELFESGALAQGEPAARICEVMGSERLFEFVHENPLIEMAHSGMIHEPAEIARLPGFVSVISAIEVDLSGQVAAESVGPKPVAGIGGQLDFAMGAAMNSEGRTIVALPSRGGRDASRSRIVATLSGGAAVTTPRSLIDYVVTEHGIADLRGKDLDARARRLIGVAAPEFREELEWSWREQLRPGP